MRTGGCILALLVWTGLSAAATDRNLSSLAPVPDWPVLAGQGGAVDMATFRELLDSRAAPGGAWKEWIRFDGEAAFRVRRGPGEGWLRVSLSGDRRPIRYWRSAEELGPAPPGRPLAGLRIALDPGHLGGEWAEMEQRHFTIGDGPPAREGDLVLVVADLLRDRLERLGATVHLLRADDTPATSLRPDDLLDEARRRLRRAGADNRDEAAVRRMAARLFVGTAEIRARARKVNEEIRPDLVIALHFNAAEWRSETEAGPVDENHLHVLVFGAVMEGEIARQDVRFEMLQKLLTGAMAEELPVAVAVADRLVASTGLPPYRYTGNNAVAVPESAYVWGRNLLANRLYACPVVYLEPWVANHGTVYARLMAGDFPGVRRITGEEHRSIFREYADAVAAGLADHYRRVRPEN